MIYSVWQNIRFVSGGNSFEVMPGRPNGTFTEADWLGVYLVFLLASLFTLFYALNKKSSAISHQSSNKEPVTVSRITDDRLLMTKKYTMQIFLYIFLTLIFVTLILTVSRSAWVGAAFVVIGFLKFVLYDGSWKFSNWQWKKMLVAFGNILVALALSIFIVYIFGLTKFQLGSRAVSTGGLQKITISCQRGTDNVVPANIGSVEELAQYNCRHINLEEIENEKIVGNVVMEVNRPDPNVNIRSEIYQQSIAQIKMHPVLGIGWNSISKILGTDERGAGLNASDIFLEVWLGSGLLGILSFVILLLYIFIKGTVIFFKQDEKARIVSVFVLLGWTAIIIPNLFNSGIFLGFVWVYFGIAIGLLEEIRVRK
jgi:hypothetical protein